ncbi:SEC-C metal-binding domain-containing protein [Granulicella sp. S190]|uniref:SEC-C metal-binding domain-containing protein n=1 Tax=Granulicella sp. S190 TaxID=1747226 RepID=UPI003529FEC1
MDIGRHHPPVESNAQHWAHPLLVNMDVSCEVMLCIQEDAMPRAYLITPRFQPYYADTLIHPHPRGDQFLLYEGRPLPGLCVFSSAEMVFTDAANFCTQFLDQLTQYVAKHLIWLRTRRLCRRIANTTSVLYQPLPGETILEQPPRRQVVQWPTGPVQAIDFWSGYWPGKGARAMTPAEHLRQIRSNQSCWCGLNKKYGDCHKAVDLLLVNRTADNNP